jgi:hypothetical protein
MPGKQECEMTLTKSALPGAIFVLTFFAQPTFAHDFWINHGNYKSPADGSHCCGDNDCKMLSPEEVRITPRGYVLTNGELVPFSEAQGSEDGLFWRCKRHDGSRRCFFAPQPSS